MLQNTKTTLDKIMLKYFNYKSHLAPNLKVVNQQLCLICLNFIINYFIKGSHYCLLFFLLIIFILLVSNNKNKKQLCRRESKITFSQFCWFIQRITFSVDYVTRPTYKDIELIYILKVKNIVQH